ERLRFEQIRYAQRRRDEGEPGEKPVEQAVLPGFLADEHGETRGRYKIEDDGGSVDLPSARLARVVPGDVVERHPLLAEDRAIPEPADGEACQSRGDDCEPVELRDVHGVPPCCCRAVCPCRHSARNASTGASREARTAGRTPDIRPIATAMPSARN